MTKRLEKMLKDYDQALVDQAKLETEMEEFKRQEQAYKQEAEEAAKLGDDALYFEKIKAAEMAKGKAYVKSCQLDRPLLPENDAKTAWKEFADDYKKAYTKAREAFEKARLNLYASFMAMVHDQEEALRTREKLAKCTGLELGFDPTSALDQAFPLCLLPDRIDYMKTVGVGLRPLHTPETDYFFDAQIAGPSEVSYFNSVIRLHRPSDC